MGHADGYPPLATPAIHAALGSVTLKDYRFRWSDLNGDGELQADEVVLAPSGKIGYTTDFQGTLPLGFAYLGPGQSTASGTAPNSRPTMEGWVYSVSGYLNPSRENGYTMPWTWQAYVLTDEQDNNAHQHQTVACGEPSFS